MPNADWKRICCPIDFSDASRAAMEVAADLARRNAGSLTLLHAYPVPGYTFPDGSVVASPKMMQDLAEQAKRHLDEWRREAEALGAPAVDTATAVGEPATEIVGWAADQRADVLVLGTHGRTGLEHALMGSIAERVVRRARCPVVTVHPHGPAK
ncbi:universal stress protein [Anaeromyxobacter dehalogenans]|uniref:Universal stress protein UspA n=1 Tax=Anaeromyxobacter dehalogenans (strain 2CP-C) TaxID=290397 RepID=Q2IP04_ANADE|nr:universal stress protein [Anaeromyxobacter dehalogenans]ABC80536.1 universal stress protein UspA [Anaeromyxobacter dehalogenans 2CP-C]